MRDASRLHDYEYNNTKYENEKRKKKKIKLDLQWMQRSNCILSYTSYSP